MATKTFSLILPSRLRASFLTTLARNVRDLTDDISEVEMLVAIDDDDLALNAIAPGLMKEYNWLHIYTRPRSTNCSEDYINWLWRKSSGRYLWVLNDDIRIATGHWDTVMREAIQRFEPAKEDDILLGCVHDGSVSQGIDHYCEFPVISNAGAQALGYCLCPRQPGWHADSFIHAVYSAVKRVADIRCVQVTHYRPADVIHYNLPWTTLDKNQSISEDVDKLLRRMSNGHEVFVLEEQLRKEPISEVWHFKVEGLSAERNPDCDAYNATWILRPVEMNTYPYWDDAQWTTHDEGICTKRARDATWALGYDRSKRGTYSLMASNGNVAYSIDGRDWKGQGPNTFHRTGKDNCGNGFCSQWPDTLTLYAGEP